METTNNRFISLLSDYGFKATFANEANTLFLRKSLQALIQSPHEIKAVEFLRNEFPGLTEEARGGVYDLFCQDERENAFIVEMQLGHYKHFIQRAKFYAFHRLNTLIERGKYKFDNLTPIYCISFLAKNILPKSEQYYHFATLKNQIGEELDRQIVHVIVEISKFKKTSKTIQTDLDKLIYIMKQSETIKDKNQLPDFAEEDWIQQALKKVDRSKMTPEQRMWFAISMAKKGSIIEMEEMEKKRREEEMEKKFQAKVKETVKEAEETIREAKETAREAKETAREAKETAREAEETAREAEETAREAKEKIKAAEERAKKAEEREKKVEKERLTKVVLAMKKDNLSTDKIASYTGLSIPEIENL